MKSYVSPQIDVSKKGGHGNTRLPFGLCSRYGISLPSGATPRDAWNALKEKGVTPENVYSQLKSEITKEIKSDGKYQEQTPYSKLSLDELKSLRDEYDNKSKMLFDKAESVMNTDIHSNSQPKEYYNYLQQANDMKSKVSKISMEIGSRNKPTEAEQHKFVNSYGEATKRNISSSTYEKAQKRQEKDVLRNLGL